MLRGLITVAGASLVVAGCFTTTADFRNDAETFIEQDEDLRTAAFFESSTSFVEATCAEPENQDEGSTFPCTATDSDGDVWEFEIVITGSAEYEVVISRRPDDS